jgi:GTP pyrophosphokinase
MDNYDFDIEQAIKFLADSMPTEGLTKPTLLHSVRVGLRLYSDNYSKELIIAGLLHDLVEDTAITIDDVKEKFGERVAKLVELNTKNSEIQDKKERTMDLITRSAMKKIPPL